MTKRNKYKPTIRGRELSIGDTLYEAERREVVEYTVCEIDSVQQQVYVQDPHRGVRALHPAEFDRLFLSLKEALDCSIRWHALFYAAGALHDAYLCVGSLSHHSITVDTATKIRNLTEELSKVVEQARKEIKQCP